MRLTLPKGKGDKAWLKQDTLVKIWIYDTISEPLLQMVMKRGGTAQQLRGLIPMQQRRMGDSNQ